MTLAAPLNDVRVLAVTDYGAGPFCTQMLAELGADVIKIENPGTGGESGRRIPRRIGTSSLFFESVNRGVRSVALDLKHPEGHRLLERIIPECDVVFSNLRADAVSRLGLRYEHLASLKPELVCCFLTGWGLSSARSADPAYDYGVQAFTGHMALTGEPGSPPARSAAPWVDFGTAMTAAFAMLAALHDARATGQGQDVDVSMIGFAMAMWSYMATGYLTDGQAPRRTSMSAHQSVVPSQAFRTADGYVIIMCQTDAFWRNLCEGMELPDLLEDDRLATIEGRAEHREIVLASLERRFGERTSDEWMKALAGLVPIERINTFSEAVAAFEDLHPDQIVSLEHEILGPYRVIGNPIRLTKAPLDYRRAPLLGEHTHAVLRDLVGCTDEEIARLENEAVVTGEGSE